jgi:hypothetical protein
MNILGHWLFSAVILYGHAVAHALGIVFSQWSTEFIPMEVGKFFSKHFIFPLPVIVPPVLWIWLSLGWFIVPQLSCSAKELDHTLPVQ